MSGLKKLAAFSSKAVDDPVLRVPMTANVGNMYASLSTVPPIKGIAVATDRAVQRWPVVSTGFLFEPGHTVKAAI